MIMYKSCHGSAENENSLQKYRVSTIYRSATEVFAYSDTVGNQSIVSLKPTEFYSEIDQLGGLHTMSL